jgi:hypothetical protein
MSASLKISLGKGYYTPLKAAASVDARPKPHTARLLRDAPCSAETHAYTKRWISMMYDYMLSSMIQSCCFILYQKVCLSPSQSRWIILPLNTFTWTTGLASDLCWALVPASISARGESAGARVGCSAARASFCQPLPRAPAANRCGQATTEKLLTRQIKTDIIEFSI